MILMNILRVNVICISLLFVSACGATVGGTPSQGAPPDANIHYQTGLKSDGACRNSTEYFRKLIGNIGDASEAELTKRTGMSPLEVYAWIDDSRRAEAMLKDSASNSDVASAISAAATANSVSVLNKILQVKDFVTEQNLTNGLLSAAQCGNVPSVNTLIARGANPNSANNEGLDAVMVSLVSRHFTVTEILLKAGYDSCAATTKNGKSIKALAKSVGALEIDASLKDCY